MAIQEVEEPASRAPTRQVFSRRRLVVAVLAVQFLIPLVALVGSTAPTRLGFQMYSGQGELTIQVVDGAGDARNADLNDLLAAGRPDIDWVSNLTTCAATTRMLPR